MKERVAIRRLDEECDASPTRVSYVIVTRNRANFLRSALENVREFKEPGDELIVMDGGSNDDTEDLVRQYSDIVDLFVSESDSGEAHAFNKALSLCRGRYVKPLTDDDYFHPEAMRKLVTTAEATKDWDAIQTGGEHWAENNGKLAFHHYHRVERNVDSQTDIFSRHIGLGLILRRRAIWRIGGCSPGYKSVDGDLHCKLIEAGCRVRYLDINLYRWNLYAHSGARDDIGMARSHLLFYLRLKDWRNFFLHDPTIAAKALGLDQIPHGLSLQHAIYWAARVCFSDWGRMLDRSQKAMYWLREGKRGAASIFHSVSSEPKSTEQPLHSSVKFTGTLSG